MSDKSNEEVINVKKKLSPIEEHSGSRKRLHPFSVERILQDDDNDNNDNNDDQTSTKSFRKSVTPFSDQSEGKNSEMEA